MAQPIDEPRIEHRDAQPYAVGVMSQTSPDMDTWDTELAFRLT